MIKIYVCDISNVGAKNSLDNVSKERIVKASKLKDVSCYKQSIYAYKLLFYAFKQENIDILNETMEYNEYGKPFFPNIKNYFFNMTHSKNFVGVAIANSKVGIDIEEINFSRHIDKICRKVFTNDEEIEYNSFSNEIEKFKYFFTRWTSKESYLKMTGQGLSKELVKTSIETNNILISDDKKNTYSLSYICENKEKTEIIMIDCEILD